MGRELRYRRRHWHSGGRPGLSGSVHLQRQTQQADADDRPAAVVAGRHSEAAGGNAQQQGQRITGTETKRGSSHGLPLLFRRVAQQEKLRLTLAINFHKERLCRAGPRLSQTFARFCWKPTLPMTEGTSFSSSTSM